MPDLEAQIFSAALIVFLLTGAAKLTIEQLISLVILFKKLKATIKSDYSLESGKLEMRTTGERDESSHVTAAPRILGRLDSASERVNPPHLAKDSKSSQGHEKEKQVVPRFPSRKA